MHFRRPAIIDPLTKAEVRPAVDRLILGDGTAVHDGVRTVALPASFDENATFTVDHLNNNPRLFVGVFVEALGGDGLTGVDTLVEFLDPDWGVWVPSAAEVDRDEGAAAHTWSLVGVGTYVVATRQEHRNYTKARVRFKATAGSADAATVVRANWFTDAVTIPANMR